MRLMITVLLLAGCATARTDRTVATPTATVSATEREAVEAQQLAATLETSLANPTPAVTEPTPPEPIWVGYMIADVGRPGVVALFPEDGIIDDQTIANGVRLTAEPYRDGWRFPITRGALLLTAIRVDDAHRVTVEMPLHGEYDGTTIVVAAGVLEDPDDGYVFTPCSAGICGPLRKAVANLVVGCEGTRCAEVLQPTQ